MVEELDSRDARNSFERNLKLFRKDPDAPVHPYRSGPCDVTPLLAQAANVEISEESELNDNESLHGDSLNDPEDMVEENASSFVPRAAGTFWKRILKGVCMRARPPFSYCNMCAEGPSYAAELLLLKGLLAIEADATAEIKMSEEDASICYGKYESKAGVLERYKQVLSLHERRVTHENWLKIQRPVVRRLLLSCCCLALPIDTENVYPSFVCDIWCTIGYSVQRPPPGRWVGTTHLSRFRQNVGFKRWAHRHVGVHYHRSYRRGSGTSSFGEHIHQAYEQGQNDEELAHSYAVLTRAGMSQLLFFFFNLCSITDMIVVG